MIEVRYLDRLGNNLFQYCFGRILAERLGYRLNAPPISGFRNTSAEVPGEDHASLAQEVLLGDRPLVQRQKIDLDAVCAQKNKRHIIVEGYFQRYEYYQPYKDAIRNNWLFMDGLDSPEKISPRDIVIHVRRTDEARRGTALDFSYFEDALSRADHERVYICTDDPADPFLKKFRKFKAIVREKTVSALDDFRFILSFNKIVLSMSTFSWWAAFLSRASEIYFPLALNGYWSANHPDIDMRVDDENRYIYVPCRKVYQRSFKEMCAHGTSILRTKIVGRLEQWQ